MLLVAALVGDVDAVARLVGGDGGAEFVGAVDGLTVDGGDDVPWVDAGVGGGGAGLDVDDLRSASLSRGDWLGGDAEECVVGYLSDA